MIEVNVAHDQHTVAGSVGSMSMHPGNHKTRAWQKSNSDAAACIVANGKRHIPSVLHVSHRTYRVTAWSAGKRSALLANRTLRVPLSLS